jgi:DNA polymerase-4
VAREIKAKIFKKCGECIKCSVGIADNKLLAKIGSDLQKPDGLTVIRPQDKDSLYDRLKLTDIPGIARRTEGSLNSLGIFTLRELRDYPYDRLVAHFGIMGHHLHCAGQLRGSWGEGSFGGERAEVIKSMGHAYTMPARTSDPDVVVSVLCKLSEMVGRRLRLAGLSGTNVHCTVGKFSQQVKVGHQLNDGREIFLEAVKMFEGYLASAGARGESARGEIFRYVGVTVSGLQHDSGQAPLFERERRAAHLVASLDKINDKYGDFTVSRVPAWKARSIIRDSIGFGRMKEFRLNFKNAKER